MADSVTKERTFDTEPEELWRAISEESELERWLAEEVELDAVEGGELRVVTEDGEERRGTVLEVEEGSRLVFEWGVDGGEPSLVELVVVPALGGARLIVTETVSAPQRGHGFGGFGPLMSARSAALAEHLSLLVCA